MDFDNTLVLYDALFAALCREEGLLEGAQGLSKRVIRDRLRELEGGEERWQWLQARAYGRDILRAVAAPGAQRVLGRLREAGTRLFLVSHKSRHPAADPAVDLCEAALRWLRESGFYGELFAQDAVFFEPERALKLRRIGALGCDVFIDDLPEVLGDPAFPAGVRRVWFSQERGAEDCVCDVRCASWSEIEGWFFG